MQDIAHEPAPQRRILLVEDDADLREVLCQVLESSGHTVIPAIDGTEGLSQMRACRPDIVVLDLMMPRLDGWQFRLAQRDDPMLAMTPVIAISASSSATAAAVDADLYLRKPFDAETLLRAIDDVINATARRLEPTKVAQTERLAALGTLAAGLAHEINNPLAYVLLQLAHASRLIPTLANGENRALVDQVESLIRGSLEGAERIRNIMAGIRAFSRSDDAGVEPVDVRVPLDAALKLVMNEIRHRARLIKNYAAPPLVLANEGRLGQVFLNLITNAVQAIPEGDTQAHEIRVSATADDTGDLVVELSDTGGGIPPHLLGRIFEPYFSTKPAGQGTGLGLSISQGIISSFDGKITVASEVGRGTTFRIMLPAVRHEKASC
ncbi:MAG TPA: ATP-binding protein [Kofleriaceae bacterium]|nr:ATP-binding protein [Kofleriaceae bacterium]